MRVTLHVGNLSVDGEFRVIEARCIHGPIRIGDCFNTIYTTKLNPDWTLTWTLLSGAIDLRVERLETYGKTMDTIDEGLTLKAWVSGSGLENLTLNQYVSNDNALGGDE
jgi:hypothetical protein